MFGECHGKGMNTAIAALIARFASHAKDKHVDLMIGEIDSSKDSLPTLAPLIKRLECGFKSVKFNKKGDANPLVYRSDGKKPC